MNWAVFLGAFAGSLIELVEILAVVLVVGSVAGWRNALVGAGSAGGLVVIGALVRYYGGVLQPKDDEDERLRERLVREGRPAWNLVALAAFKSSLLESVEIAVVVVGFGVVGGDWFESIGGALLAAVGLILFAVLLRTPLSRVPVKAMKFFASMLLTGFGTYWLGEGLNYEWPTGEWSVLWLPLLWGAGMAAAAILRSRRTPKR